MILQGSEVRIARISLGAIHLTEVQPRMLKRVVHYYKLLTKKRYRKADAGLLSVMPHPTCEGGYILLDGHHRFLAAVLAGRQDVLAVVIMGPDKE